MIHALKTAPEYFEASAAGIKNFDVRKDDRPYSPGDYVALNEWDGKEYTGKCTLNKIVYILSDTEYCKEGYVILGLEPCTIRTRGEVPKPTHCNRGGWYMRENKAGESLRELSKGDLGAAFKGTIEEMQRPKNIEKAANSISGVMAAVQRKIKE